LSLLFLVFGDKTRSGGSAETRLGRLLANTFFRDDTPSSAEDAFVGADGNDGVHVRTGDIFASAERVQGSLVVGVLVARFEVGDLGAAKDGLKG
jgi:hypothetical protein